MAEKQHRSTFVCDYFDEDIVYRISKRGKTEFGVVVENCENASSDEEDDDNSGHWYRDSWKRLKPGLTKIAWYPKGNTEVVAEKKVKLYDRSLLPGDVVRFLRQTSKNQHGYCKDTNVTLTLRIQGTDKVIENVSCSDFIALSSVSADVVCVYNSWVGYVSDIKYNVTIKFDDGSTAVVLMDDIVDFEDVWDERDDSSEFVSDVFYVGQQISGPKRCIKHANWLNITNELKLYLDSKNRKHCRIRVTVTDVSIASLVVKWLCCVANDSEHSFASESPSITITGDEILKVKCLNYFHKSSLQVGDEGYHIIKETDIISPYRKWLDKMTNCLSTAPDELSSEVAKEDAHNENEWQNLENSDEEPMSIQDNDRYQSVSSSTSSVRGRKAKYTVSVKKIRKKKIKPSKRKDLRPEIVDLSVNNKVAVEVVAEKTDATVVWQNGDVETNIPSSSLYPIHHIDNHDFFPGDFVVDNNKNSVNIYGVIQRVDYTARTALVKWFKMFDETTAANEPELVQCENVSVYDIKDHPDFHYRPGCCVIRITRNSLLNTQNESRVGQVIDLTIDGKLLCAWSDGVKSFAFPQQLFIIGEYDSDDLWADSEDESDAEDSFGSWETQSERTVLGSINSPTQEPKNPRSARKSKEAASGDVFEPLRRTITQLEEWLAQNQNFNNRNSIGPMQKIFKVCRELNTLDGLLGTNLMKLKELHSLVDSTKPPPESPGTIQVVSNKMKRFLSSLRMSQPATTSSNSLEIDQTRSNNTELCIELLKKLKTQLSQVCSSVDANSVSRISRENTDLCSGDAVDGSSVVSDKSTEEMKEDDVVFSDDNNTCGQLKFMDSVPECHKFKLSIFVPKNPKLFMKQVRKEITLLESSLPLEILVKTFSDRMDLFSVMIKGAKCTPYEDGLFLFDVQLPSSYPEVPPVVHYLSFCNDRLNPNLYDTGKVCVSLLGTWNGKGTEVWTPTSTLLQVLISIQGLILVDEPYFNEAGYLKQKGTLVGQENSRLYNEMVVVKLVQSMSKLIESPGDIFADEIREHFANTGSNFIKRLEKWLQVSNENSANTTEYQKCEFPEFPLLPGSQGFCLSLQRALSHFKQCLTTAGISVD
ncbi:E2/E3 hybrid ubiquitin-protein ligase UBE2O-like protein [Leptotrombidium deliense]|uniref:E2/E3 hybrid ubiquitin-protein ligase UBE2O-like protein n=1 Tax=Leptotrombidium deliense TaxID=299467 RepID=A0A443SKE4_9ACAR|nr:E2/E3 hybrid ubiquitin-protein ligase UBE2O-like protein [Leptotrombidium deliense]